MKKFLKISVASVLIQIFVLSFFTSNVALASLSQDELAEMLKDKSIETCQQDLVPIYEDMLKEFLLFLDGHFKNTSSSSTLTNAAIAKFQVYKDDIYAIYQYLQNERIAVAGEEADQNVIQAKQQSSTPDLYGIRFESYLDAVGSIAACQNLADKYVYLAREQMFNRITKTTASKKTLAIVEKYEEINKNLKDLNFKISQVEANFKTFENKLPGFIQKCMKSLF